MSVKVIAIGNPLMGNDAVGIRVLEYIQGALNEKAIETYACETDFDYCLSVINEGDVIFILDAAILGTNPGEITVVPIDGYKPKDNGYTQHQHSLLDMLHIYKKNIKGYIIAIEVGQITFSLSLSINLKHLLKDISLKIFNLIICES